MYFLSLTDTKKFVFCIFKNGSLIRKSRETEFFFDTIEILRRHSTIPTQKVQTDDKNNFNKTEVDKAF